MFIVDGAAWRDPVVYVLLFLKNNFKSALCSLKLEISCWGSIRKIWKDKKLVVAQRYLESQNPFSSLRVKIVFQSALLCSDLVQSALINAKRQIRNCGWPRMGVRSNSATYLAFFFQLENFPEPISFLLIIN